MSTAVPPMIQLAATLSLFATGSFQHAVGNDYLIGMCQSTVSKFVQNVAKEMEAKLCPNFIQFSPEHSFECMEAFMRKYKIPGGKYKPKKNLYLNAFSCFKLFSYRMYRRYPYWSPKAT